MIQSSTTMPSSRGLSLSQKRNPFYSSLQGRQALSVVCAYAVQADAESIYVPNSSKGPVKKMSSTKKSEVPVLLGNGKKALVHKKRRTVSVVTVEPESFAKKGLLSASGNWMTLPALIGAVAISWAAFSTITGRALPGSLESSDSMLKSRTASMLSDAKSEMASAEKVMSGVTASKPAGTTNITPVTAKAPASASIPEPSAVTARAVAALSATTSTATKAASVSSTPTATSTATDTAASSSAPTSTAAATATLTKKAAPPTARLAATKPAPVRQAMPTATASPSGTTVSSQRAQSILTRVDDILNVLDRAAASDRASLPPFASQVADSSAGILSLMNQSAPTSTAPVQASAPGGININSFNSSSGGSSTPPGMASSSSSVLPAPTPPPRDSKPTKMARERLKEQNSAAVWKETEEAPIAKVPSPKSGLSNQELKSGLLDVVYGTTRGVTASGEQRAAIEEYITDLEAVNPHNVATDALEVLEGRWKLVYTSNTQTLMLLNAIDSIPLVDIGDVYQVIDGKTLTAHNKIDIAVPVMLSLSAEAGFEVRTPRQFKVRFHKMGLDTYIQTPQLLAAIDMPDSITVLGTTIDLTMLRTMFINPMNSAVETAQAMLQQAVSPQFDMNPSEMTSLWMLTTYLDGTLRISRDDSGRVFVMLKDVSIDSLVSR